MAVSQKYPTGPQPNGNPTTTKNPNENQVPAKGSQGDSPHFRIAVSSFLMRNGHISKKNVPGRPKLRFGGRPVGTGG